ncbi:MAG: lasso peptide biosynthesis B2 protein [Gemmatimonadetes bacterium]|nr:lasso peptide biosynthesis B2 protein [Gemmatimonadota bacterium]
MRPASPLWCLMVLAAVRTSLKAAGFRRTIRWAQRLAPAPHPEARRELVEAQARAVAVAAAFFPGRAICLEQSIALYLVLRRRRVPAVLRIGVQPYPFAAHAWVELDGQPIYENEDDLAKFVAFPGLA